MNDDDDDDDESKLMIVKQVGFDSNFEMRRTVM